MREDARGKMMDGARLSEVSGLLAPHAPKPSKAKKGKESEAACLSLVDTKDRTVLAQQSARCHTLGHRRSFFCFRAACGLLQLGQDRNLRPRMGPRSQMGEHDSRATMTN